MEAWRFGFDPSLPPAFKFDPTDADLVAYYLLPRALNIPNNNPPYYAHAVVDADPGSCPPWELLRRHGHAGSDHAFFFGPPREVSKTGAVARTARGVPAGEDGGGVRWRGKWRGQKGQEEKLFLYHAGGEEGEEEKEIVVTYKKYNLTYYDDPVGEGEGDDKVSASGWVMQEYQIVDPPMRDVLARVKVADRASKQHRKKRKAAAAETMSSYQEDQPAAGPSNYYYHHHHHVDGSQAAAGTSSSTDQQIFGVPESENDHGGEGMEEPVLNYTDDELLHSGEGIGCFLEDSNNYVMGNMDMGDYYNQLGYGDGNSNCYGGGGSGSYYHGDAE